MQRKYIVLLHFTAWILFFINRVAPGYIYNIYERDAYGGSFTRFFFVELGYLSTTILTFYFTAYVIAPALIRQRKWIKGILYFLLLLLISTAYRWILEFKIMLPLLDYHNYHNKVPEIGYYIKNNINYLIYKDLIYGVIFFIASEWYMSSRKQRELEQEKVNTELAFLKSQINPHFLFNTINDIYALTYQKSDLAPDALLKLSEVLRYMLKDSDEDLSSLDKEVIYLQNVIELHEIGQKGFSYVNFSASGDIKNTKIAPLILINFIENAFKHGVTNQPEHPIQIKIDVHHSLFEFSVTNLKNNDIKDQSGGIGLANIKRRLNLIYPKKHQLDIREENDTFSVYLKIELT